MLDQGFVRRQIVIRRTLLVSLYEQRQAGQNGFVRDLTHTLGHDPQDSEFALAFLVEASFVHQDSIHCQITALGMQHLEKDFLP